MKLIPDTFDHRLALECAQGFESPDKIYPRYGITPDEWKDLKKNKEFRMLVEKYLADMQKDGTSFRNKAGVLAEDVLYVAHSIATNVENSTGARMEAVQWLAKVSGKDESANKTPASNAPPFMIAINLGENNQKTMTLIQPEKVTDEQ